MKSIYEDYSDIFSVFVFQKHTIKSFNPYKCSNKMNF